MSSIRTDRLCRFHAQRGVTLSRSLISYTLPLSDQSGYNGERLMTAFLIPAIHQEEGMKRLKLMHFIVFVCLAFAAPLGLADIKYTYSLTNVCVLEVA
jgi:hypothetical protein